MSNCDYDTSKGHTGNIGCYKGKQEYEVIISYDEHNIEKDVLHLCSSCTKALKKDVRKHKYKFKSVKL